MFKKTQKRNIRQRKEVSDEEDGPISAVPTSNKSKTKRKSKKDTSKLTSNKESTNSLLSFGADEEEDGVDVFKLKKSSRSKRIAKQIKKMAQDERSEVVAPGTAGSGEYSKENLEKLKQATLRPVEHKMEEMIQNDFTAVDPSQPPINDIQGLRPGEIPTPAAIHAARKQRELFRKYGNEYIALDDTDRFKESGSRLVRDDDNDASDDEDGPNVAMKGVIDDAERVKCEIADDIDSDHRDDEINRWEEQLIRTGKGFQQQGALNGNEATEKKPFYMNGNIHKQFATPKNTNFTSSPSDMLFNVRKRVKDRLELIKEINHGRERERDRVKLDTEECESTAGKLVDTKELEKHYNFFQQMHNHVHDLIDCLNEKVPEIEFTENKIHKLWKQRSNKIVSRRQQDVQDESADISAIASGKQTTTDDAKATRTRERDARRTRRRAARQMRGTKNHNNGMSTDDEETTSGVAKWESTMLEVAQEQENLFHDVIDEFYDIRKILEKFDQWRDKFPATYNDAYIGLCLPKILAPFVRLSIVQWNPLLDNCANLEGFIWFRNVMEYARGKKENDAETILHQDERILPILFEKVIIPKLNFVITEVWDPMSLKQSNSLMRFINSVREIYPCMRIESKRLQGIVTSICAKFQTAINDDIFIPLLPVTSLGNITSGPGAFLERQTWTCLKLYKNILIFSDIIAPKSIHELAFDSILNRYVLLALQTSPVTSGSIMKCQFIADAIPYKWLDPEFNDIQGHLLPMCKYLLHAAEQIHTHLASTTDKKRGRDCLQHISRILLHIGEDVFEEQINKLLVQF